MSASDTPDEIPDNWSAIDSERVFFEYVEMVREMVKRGEPLPRFFRSTREAAE